ncbi:Gmad2 immunoglobulin-like domain-containing protein [Kineococcus sp. SYSU DK001]|uniref:Gmad2 immunoglobulin-like domain-containing protein n=1 Tax=Kineococcus sp. SYSU DK001 TaxID=3383122 RepID=UPI003D7D0A98
MNDQTPLGPLPDPDGDDDLSPTARQLRDALAARAAGVAPTDRLEEIRMSSRARRRRTRAWAAVAGAAAAVVVGGGAYAVTQRGGDEVRVVAAASSSEASEAPGAPAASPEPSTAPASSAPASSPAAPRSGGAPTSSAPRSAGTASTAPVQPLPSGAASVPVYWLGGQPAKLFREYVAAGDGANDATNALRAMLAGAPGDPDYSSPWSADPSAQVTASGGQLVVDLSPAAAAGTAADPAAALQQLVHTVTAAAGSNDPVVVRVDGATRPTLFGTPVPAELTRAPQADVQAPAWITRVVPGSGSVTVEGVGTAFEGTLLYTVTDAAGTEVARDAVQAGANGTFGEFSFTARVPAGTYTVAVSAPDESNGEGTPGVGDTKDVTVR